MKCGCGCTLFFRNYRARGWWKQLVDFQSGKANVEDTNLDNVRGPEPKTMICADCGKRHLNPDHKDNQ